MGTACQPRTQCPMSGLASARNELEPALRGQMEAARGRSSGRGGSQGEVIRSQQVLEQPFRSGDPGLPPGGPWASVPPGRWDHGWNTRATAAQQRHVGGDGPGTQEPPAPSSDAWPGAGRAEGSLLGRGPPSPGPPGLGPGWQRPGLPVWQGRSGHTIWGSRRGDSRRGSWSVSRPRPARRAVCAPGRAGAHPGTARPPCRR